MSSEVEPYNPTPLALTRAHTDDWFDVFPDIIKLAEYISDTSFVPDTIRRQPGAIAATILTGRELGLAPMTSLRHIFIVKGRPGQSAELMRALILREGHEIRFIEATDTRCIVEGRRKDETDYTRVQFTVEDARNAAIDIRSYPADKLVARATSRLARRKFADVIMGLPTVDELEDYDADIIELGAPDGRPVQRKRRTRKPKAAATQPAPAPQADDDINELLGDDETPQKRSLPDDRSTEADGPGGRFYRYPDEDTTADELDHGYQGPEHDGDDEDEAQARQLGPTDPDDDPITEAQMKKLQIELKNAGFLDRATCIDFVSAAIGREVQSRKELTKTEASKVITILVDDQ